MEFNPQNSDEQGGPGQVRSFTCGFCKRGFSNAQALGGHMNIHRRDRAKLRQLSCEENSVSLDISIKNNSTTHDIESSRPFYPEKDDYAIQRGKAIQLPLFVGKPTSSNVVVERIEEKKSDLDLELRLGREPQETPTLSTREFF